MSKNEPTLVLVETPFRPTGNYSADEVERFLDAALLDCIDRGEAPYATHRFFTTILDDDIPNERMLGIRLGLAWGRCAHKTVVYTNLGISPGMKHGIRDAELNGRPIEYRELSAWGAKELTRKAATVTVMAPSDVEPNADP